MKPAGQTAMEFEKAIERGTYGMSEAFAKKMGIGMPTPFEETLEATRIKLSETIAGIKPIKVKRARMPKIKKGISQAERQRILNAQREAIKEIQRQKQRAKLRQIEITKQAQRQMQQQRQMQRQIQKLEYKYEFIKPPKIITRKEIITPRPIPPIIALPKIKAKKISKKAKRKRKKEEDYIAGFTARALGLTKKLTKAQAKLLPKKIYSPFEIRPLIKIDKRIFGGIKI